MRSTSLRRKAIHGLLLGAAVGEQLGLPRTGLSRRKALRKYGKPLQGNCLPTNLGSYGNHLQLTLLTGQALLRSYSNSKAFHTAFLRRLRWYSLSFPVGMRRATWRGAFSSWNNWTGLLPARFDDNDPALRVMLLTLALYGTEHQTAQWVEKLVQLTHPDPYTINCCLVLSKLVEIAAVSSSQPLEPIVVLKQLAASARDKRLKEKLSKMQVMIVKRHSLSAASLRLQLMHDSSIESAVLLAAYGYLRHPGDYERAVRYAISAGGDTAALGALVGGLVGIHIGPDHIPWDLSSRLRTFPHGRKWIAQFADRLATWPHGADDLHHSPALPTRPVRQVLRNLIMQLAQLSRVIRNIN